MRAILKRHNENSDLRVPQVAVPETVSLGHPIGKMPDYRVVRSCWVDDPALAAAGDCPCGGADIPFG
jgi:hypothetical protein